MCQSRAVWSCTTAVLRVPFRRLCGPGCCWLPSEASLADIRSHSWQQQGEGASSTHRWEWAVALGAISRAAELSALCVGAQGIQLHTADWGVSCSLMQLVLSTERLSYRDGMYILPRGLG